jgi:hypothetical protein
MTNWYTIYSDCERLVAQSMSDEGKVRFLPMAMTALPNGHAVNAFGQAALCVVIIPRAAKFEFNKRVAELRA